MLFVKSGPSQNALYGWRSFTKGIKIIASMPKLPEIAFFHHNCVVMVRRF